VAGADAAARLVLATPDAVAAVGRKERSIDMGSARWEERAMWEGAGAGPALEPGGDGLPLVAGPQPLVGEGYQRPGEAAVAVGLGVPGTTWQAAALARLIGWAG
jgi:hypothetical protein